MVIFQWKYSVFAFTRLFCPAFLFVPTNPPVYRVSINYFDDSNQWTNLIKRKYQRHGFFTRIIPFSPTSFQEINNLNFFSGRNSNGPQQKNWFLNQNPKGTKKCWIKTVNSWYFPDFMRLFKIEPLFLPSFHFKAILCRWHACGFHIRNDSNRTTLQTEPFISVDL